MTEGGAAGRAEETRRPRVLVVEDDDATALLIERSLRDDFRVRRVATLSAAADALRDRRPDVVLLDLGLPDADGCDALRQLVTLDPEVPIVILTGADPTHSLDLLEAGAEDFLRKPELRFDVLGRSLRYAMARRSSKRLRRRLQQAERMAVIGRLAAGVAHEINNPASWALGSLEMALEHLEASEGGGGSGALSAAYLRDCLTRSLDGVDRVTRVVRDLHSFAKPQTDRPETCELAPVTDTALRLLVKELSDVRVFTDVDDGLVVACDAARMIQVLVNLLLNARNAIRAREAEVPGRIDLEAGPRSDSGRSDSGRSDSGRGNSGRGTSGHGDSVWLTVRDNGVGMDSQTREQIFDPFFSLAEDHEGSGLGLAICAEIVQAHGGEIRVESEPGAGAVFEIEMPVATAENEPLRVAESRERSEADGPIRVLVIDDEARLRDLLVSFLDTFAEAESAGGGQEALLLLAEAESRGESFDVILCDLGMPGMSGVELAQQMEPEMLQRTLFMSGGLYDDELRHFAAATRNRLLEKPVPTQVLREAVLDLAGRSA